MLVGHHLLVDTSTRIEINMAVEAEFLKSIPYFSGLSLAEIDSISRLVFEKMAERGETILVEGEPGEALYIVVSGVAKVFKTSVDGKEQTLCIVRPGESFNDVSVFDGGPNLASVQALAPITFYGIRRRDFQAILRNDPQVAMNAINVLTTHVRRLASLVEDLSFRHVIGRIAKILLENAISDTNSGPRLTQQDIASMAGTAREVVGRSLKTLEEEGLIKLDRHRIVVANTKALKEMVEMPL